MKFDDVLEKVSSFGSFQQRTILLLLIPLSTLPFHFLLNNFIAVIPAHHCNINSLDNGSDFRNLSSEERLIVSIPFEQDGSLNSCQMFAEPQYHLLSNSYNLTNQSTVPCQNGWIYDTTNFKSTLATEWDLVCDKRSVDRATAATFFMGVMVGGAIFGYLSDRYGRKQTLLWSYVLATFFGFASSVSYSLPMFATMRFFTGLGLSGISIIAIVLCIEWVDVRSRTAVCVLMSLTWSIGCALLPSVAYFINDWRYLTAAVTSPLTVAMISWWWLPESARWLMSNGKVHAAYFYLSKCAKSNGREEVMADLKPEVLSGVILLEDEKRKYSYLDLVRTPGMTRLALLTGFMWFGVACTYYGISLNVGGFGVNIYFTQFIYGIIELPAKALVFFTVDKMGRRWTQAGTLFVTGLFMLCSIYIPAGNKTFQTVMGALGKMFSEACFTTVFLHTTELYPTVMRQNGLGFSSFMAHVGVSVSSLIMLLGEMQARVPLAIFLLVAVFTGFSATLLPDTCSVCLPDTIEDVEQTSRQFIPEEESVEMSSFQPAGP